MEDAAGGVRMASVLHHEQVFARAFREPPIRAERDAFDEATRPRFASDEVAVEIIAAGLCRRRHRVRRKARPTGHTDIDAALLPLIAEIGAPRKCRDRDIDLHLLRCGRDTHAAFAKERDGPHIGTARLFLRTTALQASASSSAE